MRGRGSFWGDGEGPTLLAVAVCFFLGGAAGCILAFSVSGEGGGGLNAYLTGFLAAAEAGETVRPALWSLVWEILRWPLLILLFSCTAIGTVGIPVLFAVRGFLLSFSIASFARALGGGGELLALLLFGLPGAAAVPALFVLGTGGLLSSRTLTRRVPGEGTGSGRALLIFCGVCTAGFIASILLEYLAVPALLPEVARLLTRG